MNVKGIPTLGYAIFIEAVALIVRYKDSSFFWTAYASACRNKITVYIIAQNLFKLC